MKITQAIVISLIGLAYCGLAYAEYGCQSGFVPVYQGNRQVCVADYNLPVWKQQEQQQQQAPAEIWENRYGAVAYSRITKGYVIHENGLSRKDAENAAMEKCGDQCEIFGSFRNSCSTLSWGGGKVHLRGGGSKEESKKKSLSMCNADSATKHDCEVLHSVCSLPVRVQ